MFLVALFERLHRSAIPLNVNVKTKVTDAQKTGFTPILVVIAVGNDDVCGTFSPSADMNDGS